MGRCYTLVPVAVKKDYISKKLNSYGSYGR